MNAARNVQDVKTSTHGTKAGIFYNRLVKIGAVRLAGPNLTSLDREFPMRIVENPAGVGDA
jgi:hypothetical protein